MPKLLTLKKLNEIHFVDKGAAIGARVVFLKRNKEPAMSLKDQILKSIADALDKALQTKDEPEKHPVAKAIEDHIAKQDPASLAGMDPEKLLEQALAGVKDESTRAAIMAAVGAMYRAMPPKAKEEAPPKTETTESPVKNEPPSDEQLAAKKRFEEASKNMDAETKKAFEEITKAHKAAVETVEDLKKRLDESDKTIADEVAKREIAAETDIAKSFAHVPGDIAKRAALLLSVKKSQGEKAYADLVQTLKAADEVAAKGLKRTSGTSRSEETDGDHSDPAEAYAKLREMAQEQVAKSEKKLSVEQAISRLVKRDPEAKRLYGLARRAQ